jgi:hypothetical protein
VPRSNNSQSDSSARSRGRGPARSSTPQRSGAVDAAADMANSSPGDLTADKSAAQSPSYDEIAEAAYLRYLRRGGGDGQDFDDWVEAERELRSRRSS